MSPVVLGQPDYTHLVNQAKALEQHVRHVYSLYAVEGTNDFMDILDLTSCLEELKLLDDLRSEVVPFVTDVLLDLDARKLLDLDGGNAGGKARAPHPTLPRLRP